MNVVIKNLDISLGMPVTFVPLSDEHVGHVDFDMPYFEQAVAWIKKKRALTVLLGDQIDAILMKDKRFEVNSVDPFFLSYLDGLPQKQAEVFIDLVSPIRNQILGILWGNHEITVRKRCSYEAIPVIAKALGIPIITDPGDIVLNFHNNAATCNLKMWLSHGTFMGGRLTGSKVNKLDAVRKDFQGRDLYLAGHTHEKWAIEKHYNHHTKNFKVEERRCYLVNTGAFLRTYQEKDDDTWASRSMFSPQVPGCVRLDFYLKRKDGVRYIDIHGRV